MKKRVVSKKEAKKKNSGKKTKVLRKKIKSSKRNLKHVKKNPRLKLRLPVISSPDALPLLDSNFSWERFEKFSKDLLKLLHKNHQVSLVGVRGQKQYGIDLVAQDQNGGYFYAQNKRYKTFSVTQFKKAKKELELKRKKTILLLACDASADLRLEVLGDKEWEIWDVTDISDKVFGLENSDRYDLVKRYFGIEWAKAFSEYNEFSSLVSPIDFFRNYFDSKKLFNHTVPFVGRENELDCLKKFVNGNHHALVLNAAGGTGKSRLLWEFSKSCVESGWSILFIKEGMAPLAEHFQSIKSKKVIFVFDDAHRLAVSPYLSYIYALKNIKFKVIFSTRPQGRERLKLDLIKNSLESSEIQDYEVKKFTAVSARPLVVNFLPQIEAQHIWPIANLLADSTLVGILACNLIKRQSVSLSSLANEEDIKGKIISSFTDELSGKIDSRFSNDLIQKVLNYVSALAPVEYDEKKIDQKFITAIEEKDPDVNECIADLLHSGVIVERGGQLRISPDVLSDCILERSCYFKNDAPSDFFKNLFVRVDGRLRNNLLKNISELDWRKKKSELTSSVLLKDFWSEFKDTSSDTLTTLGHNLEIIKTIAYYQPIESYGALLNSLKTLSGVPSADRDYRFNSCLKSIVDICRDVILAGYKIEEIMMILWNLGKGDKINLNSHPEHPIRRIGDLCSYDRGFSIALYERTLKGLKAIVEEYDSEKDHHNPISMLGGFLAKTSSSSYSEGYTITLNPFHVSYDNTKKMRFEVFEVLKKLALSNDLKSSYLAVNVIADALTPPYGMVGLNVSRKQAQVWTTEIQSAINLLMEIYGKAEFSLVKVHIKNKLNQKTRWDRRSHYRPAISTFLANNPFTIEELKYVPFAFWSYSGLLIERDFEDYKKAQVEQQKIYERITKDIVSKLKTPKKILKYTEDVVSELLTVNDSIHSRGFSSILSEEINSQEMCDSLLENNSDKIEHDFSVFLKKVSSQNVPTALQYIEKALHLNNQAIISSIAEAYWWIFEGYTNDLATTEMFENIFRHVDEGIRVAALRGIRILIHQNNRSLAIKYLMALELNSMNMATNLFDIVGPYSIQFNELTDTQLSEILKKIKDIEDLSDHGVGEFISECAIRIPAELVDVLLCRVESKGNREERFVALPYLGFEKLNLNLSDDDTLKVFSKILEALKKENANTFWLPNLFYVLAKRKYELAIKYLTDLIKSGDLETVGIGIDLLRKFSNSLVFTKQDWVRDLLDHGKAKGTQYFDEIKRGLFRLGIPMEKQGTAGEPMPQDVALVANATSAIAKATSDHEKQFYTELKEYGEKEIAETKKRNQRMFDSE